MPFKEDLAALIANEKAAGGNFVAILHDLVHHTNEVKAKVEAADTASELQPDPNASPAPADGTVAESEAPAETPATLTEQSIANANQVHDPAIQP